jgi:hypothetical protein
MSTLTPPDAPVDNSSAINNAFNNALMKNNLQNNQTLQQYGFDSQGNSVNSDPNNQFMTLLNTGAQADNAAYSNVAQRGIDANSGLGAQLLTRQHQGTLNAMDSLKTNYLNSQANFLQGNTDLTTQHNTDLAANQSGLDQYQGWMNTHTVSEGGSKADPTATENGVTGWADASKGVNWADNPGAGIGRARDYLKNLVLSGNMDLGDPNFMKIIGEYNAMLKKAGLTGSQWDIGNSIYDTGHAEQTGNNTRGGDNHGGPNGDGTYPNTAVATAQGVGPQNVGATPQTVWRLPPPVKKKPPKKR